MPQISKQIARSPAYVLNHQNQSVLDRIAPIGFTDEGLKVLLYGRSGTGKTTLWATFPKPILAIICSGGSNPGELRSIDTPEYRKVISQVVLQKASEILDIGHAVHNKQTGAEFKTVVLDHASGLQDLVLKEILGLEEIPAQKGWGLATQQQYGQCTLQCKELLRSLLGLSCNMVIVAQEREFNTDSESSLITPFVGAGLTPSLVGWLNTAVDFIMQTFLRQREELKETKVVDKVVKQRVKTKAIEYCLRTGPDATYTTKFRLPRGRLLPDVLVDPTYDSIMQLIQG